MTNFQEVGRQAAEKQHSASVALSHRIHSSPELGFAEVSASGWVAELLSDAGFAVERGIAGLPTALDARVGAGPLGIAFVVEYDALPEVGHACGHNIIAATSVTAAIALKPLAEELGVTVRVIGTPAEEGGGGKVLMLERGVFAGVHAALMVHPAPYDEADPTVLAIAELAVEWFGREAHASAFPQQGLNAADAATIAQVSIGLLRQHIGESDRVHGIITHGGESPTIVPAHTAASFCVRSSTTVELERLEERVRACFAAGALATGCEVSIRDQAPRCSHFRHHPGLLNAYLDAAKILGRHGAETNRSSRPAISTDMGNVSLEIPSIHPLIGIDSGDFGLHHPRFAEASINPSADRAILDGGIALAWTAIEAATRPALRAELLGDTSFEAT